MEPEGAAALLELGAIAVPVVEAPISVEAAMAAGAAPIERAAERVARLLSLPTASGGGRKRRQIVGIDRGVVTIEPNFDDPLPEFDDDYKSPTDPLA